MVLVRSDLSDYQRKVNTLMSRAEHILSARAKDYYGEITSKVTQYVNRERELSEVKNAGVACS